jgi:phage-related holin
MTNKFIVNFVGKDANVNGSQSLNVRDVNPLLVCIKLYYAFINPKLLFSAICLDIFTKIVIPGTTLLPWMFVSLFIDFLTGILKAFVMKEKITSKRMRDTITKILQYVGSIVLVTILVNITFGKNNETVGFIVNGLYSLMILIELRSVAENFRDMSPKSRIATIILNPILSIINIRIKATDKKIKDITVEIHHPLEPIDEENKKET